jgi:hypothetical protein
MFLWTTCVLALLLTRAVPSQAQQLNGDDSPAAVEAAAEKTPQPRVFVRKDWDMTQAYVDVFKILSTKNSCSDFYGGPRVAIPVLNDLVEDVKPETLVREVSFQMGGKLRFVRNTSTGVFYRLFDKAMVNTNGAFYQRRANPMRNVPADIGSFAPGSRHARALILLHELAHLIEGENGTWLIPDDGFDVEKSKANTLRIQDVCRAELKALR